MSFTPLHRAITGQTGCSMVALLQQKKPKDAKHATPIH